MLKWTTPTKPPVVDLPLEEQREVIDSLSVMRIPITSFTDRGNPIALGVVPDQEPLTPDVELKVMREAGASLRVIPVQSASFDSDCNGWIFTGGRFWLLCRDVERILDDNGYEVVTKPRPGDLIVYRDLKTRQLTHSGLVVALTKNGKPLIESKWGVAGCYLHLPEGQTYSSSWQFYRSPRKGHLLRNLPSAEPTAKLGSEH